MKKLAFLVGKWSGDATTSRGSNETVKVKQTRKFKLGGLVLLIEGTGRNPDTSAVVFNALATISYDETAKVYRFRAYNDGRYLDTDLKVPENGFEWSYKTGPADVRFMMRLNDKGEWVETGDVKFRRQSTPADIRNDVAQTELKHFRNSSFNRAHLLSGTVSLNFLCGGRFNDTVTTLPHQSFGDRDCCGCLLGMLRKDHAEIICNECLAVVRTVPTADLLQALDEMEVSLDVCTEMCPHCGQVNVFPGFSQMLADTCQHCGRGVEVSPSASDDRTSVRRCRP